MFVTKIDTQLLNINGVMTSECVEKMNRVTLTMICIKAA